mmetsp:Transcript_13281/g.38553  ORF Transcript_13281/g.38553 Transcript_13281/m.38553 type:complete len:420 (+) Transcript_13281:1610-2869(+)
MRAQVPSVPPQTWSMTFFLSPQLCTDHVLPARRLWQRDRLAQLRPGVAGGLGFQEQKLVGAAVAQRVVGVKVHTSAGVGGVATLNKRHQSLERLDVLSGGFVRHNVRLALLVLLVPDPLPVGALVEADVGDTDGPRGVSDCHTHVNLVGVEVVSLLHGIGDDLESSEEVRIDGFLLQPGVEGSEILLCFLVPHVRLLAGGGGLLLWRAACKLPRPLLHPVLDSPVYDIFGAQRELGGSLGRSLEGRHELVVVARLLGPGGVRIPRICHWARLVSVGCLLELPFNFFLLLTFEEEMEICLLAAGVLLHDPERLFCQDEPHVSIVVRLAEQPLGLVQQAKSPGDLVMRKRENLGGHGGGGRGVGGVAVTTPTGTIIGGALLDAMSPLTLFKQSSFSLLVLFFFLPPPLELPLLEHGPFHVL